MRQSLDANGAPEGRTMDRQTSWIAEAVGGRVNGPDVLVTGPTVTDSRESVPGALYVARRGEQADGHDFIAAARSAGAVCALVDHEVADAGLTHVVVDDTTVALGDLAHAHLEDLRARGLLDVTAITGSAGKTTTKDLLAQVLSTHAPTVWPLRSFNNEVGVPLTVLRADTDTRHLILEMGASGPGHLTLLTRIAPPDIAVELMVGRAHLGGFGSQEAVATAKAELVRGLRPGGTAVLNADDPRVAAMAGIAEGPIVFFSTSDDPHAEVRAHDIAVDDLDRASFVLETPTGSAPVTLHVVGAHHVHNALAAAAAADVLGLSAVEIAAGLSHADALSPHRMAVAALDLDGRHVTLIDDSYNANPDSMRAGLAALESLGRDGHTVAVLGKMLELGDDSEQLHREVGDRAAGTGVGLLIGVGTGAEGYLDGAGSTVASRHVNTPEEARSLLATELADGDVVLVKGSNDSGVWRLADALIRDGGER